MYPSQLSKRISRLCSSVGTGVVLGLIKAYKVAVSPLFVGSCRYEPSCSSYMREAVIAYGVPRGILLGLKRLARCHPLGGHGFDPVPGPGSLSD